MGSPFNRIRRGEPLWWRVCRVRSVLQGAGSRTTASRDGGPLAAITPHAYRRSDRASGQRRACCAPIRDLACRHPPGSRRLPTPRRAWSQRPGPYEHSCDVGTGRCGRFADTRTCRLAMPAVARAEARAAGGTGAGGGCAHGGHADVGGFRQHTSLRAAHAAQCLAQRPHPTHPLLAAAQGPLAATEPPERRRHRGQCRCVFLPLMDITDPLLVAASPPASSLPTECWWTVAQTSHHARLV